MILLSYTDPCYVALNLGTNGTSKMFKDYERKIKEYLTTSSPNTPWGVLLNDHKEMVSIIQHERLIHLLVTVFVGVAMLLCSLATVMTRDSFLLLLDVPLLALFVGYIFHYRYLENTTQKWYLLTAQLKKKL